MTRKSLSKFFHWLNFLGRYYDYRCRLQEIKERTEAAARLERQEERAAFLIALQSMAAVSTEAAKASQAQAAALSTFLDSFKVTTAPTARGWDEAEDNRRYVETHLPPEMKGLDKVEQFQMLMDRLDDGW